MCRGGQVINTAILDNAVLLGTDAEHARQAVPICLIAVEDAAQQILRGVARDRGPP